MDELFTLARTKRKIISKLSD